jgi:hypothetical protein
MEIGMRGVAKMTENNSKKIHELSGDKQVSKQVPPSSKDIFSSKKHSMNYVTVDGVKLRTGYDHKADWYMLCLKELLDNAIDFLWEKYKGASDAMIDVYIEKTSKSLLRIKVRNSNPENFPVLENLKNVFDFDMTYGSKQNLNEISRGVLGDAMKQILALGYVLIHAHDDGTAFTNEQWEYPLIIRSNSKERQIILHVDDSNQIIETTIEENLDAKISFKDTEIEITLPIIDEVHVSHLDIHVIEQFCKEYPIFTTDISFKFKLVDNSPDNSSGPESEDSMVFNEDKKEWVSDLVNTLKSPARKASIEIKFPALHPIAEKWNNKGSVHTYKPGEFTTFIESVHNKADTRVYNRLQQLRESSNMKMTPDTEISIADLIAYPDKAKRIERIYKQLRNVMAAPDKLSLPYTTDDVQRKDASVKRISLLHEGRLDKKNAAYRSVDGFYDDGKISYPFVFEIVAIPYNDDSIENGGDWVRSDFKGSVNYSISPRGNLFEGTYYWNDPKKDSEFYQPRATTAFGILAVYNFHGYKVLENKAKLPCVIFANLISPKVDYHGADKSRIDTNPFTQTIIKACRKLAGDIQTFKAAGWEFSKHTRTHTPTREKKMKIEDVMTELLRTWM